MEEKGIKIIDLICKGCGDTIYPQPTKDGVTVTLLDSGGIMYTQNDEPYKFACPSCGRLYWLWKPGSETLSSNVSVFVGGSFSGNIIMETGIVSRNKAPA